MRKLTQSESIKIRFIHYDLDTIELENDIEYSIPFSFLSQIYLFSEIVKTVVNNMDFIRNIRSAAKSWDLKMLQTFILRMKCLRCTRLDPSI